MKFLLSWFADHVDLASTLGLPLEPDPAAAGRQRLTKLDDDTKAKTFQLGKTLTAIGLAVEGLEEQRWDSEGRNPVGAGSVPADRFDVLLDIDVTSNRPDCMNHVGVARELAVALATPLRTESFPSTESLSSSDAATKVTIEDREGCPRFTARVIRGVKLGPSPEWLRRRL